MRLLARIQRLEKARGGTPCPACGLGAHAEPDDLPCRVEFDIDGQRPPNREPDTCPACGRDTVRIIRVLLD